MAPFDNSPEFVLPAVETDGVLRVLIAAKSRLQDPSHWCRKPSEGGALCAGNTTVVVAEELGFDVASSFGSALWDHLAKGVPAGQAGALSWRAVAYYNDDPTTTHADILAMFDRSIAARRGELS